MGTCSISKLQVSYFCCECPILLQLTHYKWPAVKSSAASGLTVAASGLATSGFAANGLNFGK